METYPWYETMDHVKGWQKQKKISLLLVATATFSVILCGILRFVPTLNDRLSGPPEYLRWITHRAAEALAAKVGDDATILVIRDDRHDCRKIKNTDTFEPDDLYYVFYYSEMLRAFCLTTCATVADGPAPDDALVLSPSRGSNYGQRLSAPVKVVPIGHAASGFQASFLASLHWRSKVDVSNLTSPIGARGQPSLSRSLPVTFQDISLNLPELRAAVAQRHNRINTVLTALIGLFALLILAALGRTWMLYRKFRQYCLPYDAKVSLSTFLRRELRTLSDRAQRNYHVRQQEAVEQIRAASLLRRSKEAIKERLESLLEVLPDEPQRRRIQACLGKEDLDEMKSLFEELQPQSGEQTPEERLTTLLESVKEYCTSEEFDQCCAEAFAILAELGFRPARGFVVRAHDQFRARSKESEKEEIKGAD